MERHAGSGSGERPGEIGDVRHVADDHDIARLGRELVTHPDWWVVRAETADHTELGERIQRAEVGFRGLTGAQLAAATATAASIGRKALANVAGTFLEIIAEEGEESTAARRRRLFRETPKEKLIRWVMGTAYACQPKRLADVPFLLWNMAADMARGGTRVPSDATSRRQS